jgi:hypothetical protein
MRLFRAIVALAVAALALALFLPAGRACAQPAPPRTLIGLLQQQYGISTPPFCPETDTIVGTTAVRVRNNDPAAFFIVLFNQGGSNCYRSQNANVSTTTGQSVNSGGGYLEFDFRTDGTIPAQEQWVICGAAGNDIHVQTCDLQ